ncbi:hypothetical protein Q4595_16025 [Wenyingzhuangia sp. 1_MG-2023]|nr:hypothetical protein [Wenyingzhuangia sp. 1_MG-2023]
MKTDKKELGISIIKSAVGEISLIGSALNEMIDYRSKIKQKRLNKFIEILSEYFYKIPNINIETIDSENFGDIFEYTINNVVKTGSEKKLHHFKNIIINQIINPTKKIELVEIYLELISKLTEEEIIILINHRIFNNEYDLKRTQFKTIKSEYLNSNRNIKSPIEEIHKFKRINPNIDIEEYLEKTEEYFKELEHFRKSKYYNIEEKDFMFYKQSLFSKGLLKDWGVGRIGNLPFQLMSITEFGEEFINFIISSENTVGNTG